MAQKAATEAWLRVSGATALQSPHFPADWQTACLEPWAVFRHASQARSNPNNMQARIVT